MEKFCLKKLAYPFCSPKLKYFFPSFLFLRARPKSYKTNYFPNWNLLLAAVKYFAGGNISL